MYACDNIFNYNKILDLSDYALSREFINMALCNPSQYFSMIMVKSRMAKIDVFDCF